MTSLGTISLGQSVHDAGRPDLRRLEGAPSSLVSDASPCVQSIGFPIRPLGRSAAFQGRALTVSTGSLAQWKALDLAQPGDVLVIASGARRCCAEFGAVYVAIAHRKGVAAIVTDGLVRDLEEISRIPMPVFGAGAHPASPFDPQPGSIGLTATLGGVAIGPGHILVGDVDGIAIFPEAELEAVTAAVARQAEREAALQREGASGADLPSGLVRALGRVQVLTTSV